MVWEYFYSSVDSGCNELSGINALLQHISRCLFNEILKIKSRIGSQNRGVYSGANVIDGKGTFTLR